MLSHASITVQTIISMLTKGESKIDSVNSSSPLEIAVRHFVANLPHPETKGEDQVLTEEQRQQLTTIFIAHENETGDPIFLEFKDQLSKVLWPGDVKLVDIKAIKMTKFDFSAIEKMIKDIKFDLPPPRLLNIENNLLQTLHVPNISLEEKINHLNKNHRLAEIIAMPAFLSQIDFSMNKNYHGFQTYSDSNDKYSCPAPIEINMLAEKIPEIHKELLEYWKEAGLIDTACASALYISQVLRKVLNTLSTNSSQLSKVGSNEVALYIAVHNLFDQIASLLQHMMDSKINKLDELRKTIGELQIAKDLHADILGYAGNDDNHGLYNSQLLEFMQAFNKIVKRLEEFSIPASQLKNASMLFCKELTTFINPSAKPLAIDFAYSHYPSLLFTLPNYIEKFEAEDQGCIKDKLSDEISVVEITDTDDSSEDEEKKSSIKRNFIF